jgi:cytochrome c oxidase assembly protein subunit 15
MILPRRGGLPGPPLLVRALLVRDGVLGRTSRGSTGKVAAMETSLPRLRRLRLRRFAVSAQTFRRLALANTLMLMVIVASGATVRLTGSGLGCEHWPGCTAGAFFPKNGFYSYVEFSNRIVSGVTIVVTLATWLAALLVPTARPWVRWVAGGTFLGTLLQAPLGAITVHYHLNPWLVLTHFLTSITVLTLGVVVALEAYGVRGEEVPVRLKRLGLAAGAACGALVVSGTLATAAGPHSGSVDVPRVGSFQPAVWLHVRATAVFGITFAALLAWLIVRRSRHLWAAVAVLGLLAAQMTVGEIQYRVTFGGARLPWWLVLIHVTLSATVWAATTAFVATLWRPSRMR